jgi:ParB-like chromosome segregation protein Spo0J
MGLGVVPVIVKEFADEEFDRIRLMENVARKDMPDYDLAKALKHFMDKYPKTYPTQASLADVFGKEHNWVTRHLDMLNLDNIVPRGTMESGEFTERQAREILSAPEDKRAEIIDKITKTGEVPSAREIHEIVHPEEKAKPVLCAHCGEPVDHPVHLDGKFYHEDCAEQVKAEKEPGLVSEATAGPFEKESIEETETPKPEPQKIDTGFQWVCPECERKLQLIHVKLPNGKIIHQFEGDD